MLLQKTSVDGVTLRALPRYVAEQLEPARAATLMECVGHEKAAMKLLVRGQLRVIQIQIQNLHEHFSINALISNAYKNQLSYANKEAKMYFWL